MRRIPPTRIAARVLTAAATLRRHWLLCAVATLGVASVGAVIASRTTDERRSHLVELQPGDRDVAATVRGGLATAELPPAVRLEVSEHRFLAGQWGIRVSLEGSSADVAAAERTLRSTAEVFAADRAAVVIGFAEQSRAPEWSAWLRRGYGWGLGFFAAAGPVLTALAYRLPVRTLRAASAWLGARPIALLTSEAQLQQSPWSEGVAPTASLHVSPRLARYQPHLNERLRGHFERCPQIDGALTDLVVVSLRRDTGRALQSMGAPRECGVVAVDA